VFESVGAALTRPRVTITATENRILNHIPYNKSMQVLKWKVSSWNWPGNSFLL
jgi:hypothetical protein